MPTLNLYKERECSIVKLSDGKEYKIPKEFTVEQSERLLELQVERELIQAEEVNEEKRDVQLKRFWEVAFDQLESIFQCFHPEINRDYLKKVITQNEALEMLDFYREYRPKAMRELIQQSANEAESKKKLN